MYVTPIAAGGYILDIAGAIAWLRVLYRVARSSDLAMDRDRVRALVFTTRVLALELRLRKWPRHCEDVAPVEVGGRVGPHPNHKVVRHYPIVRTTGERWPRPPLARLPSGPTAEP
ncbi:MAG TPA: hypothetical protein VIL73_05220 [Gaiellaceae bacterium]